MAVLKLSTPGVYVQEIPSLPPSVAEVETAIPAFVGYTEKADKLSAGDLIMIPTKISNFTEFTTLYGNAPSETDDSIKVSVTDSGSSQYDVKFEYDDTKRSKYNLYYSLKSFFDNGGGTCFIVAVDTFAGGAGAVKVDDLTKGLDKVKDVDEVTLLCVPEAANIDKADPANYKTVVQAMVDQAANPDLRDRFAIIDPYKVTLKSKTYTDADLDADIKFIRDISLSSDSTRYAAVYYPNLTTAYAYSYDFDNLQIDAYTLAAGATASIPIAVNDKMSKFAGSVFYNKIKDTLNKEWVVIPPSGAIAGLYTRVDNTKGVWKAPANEALVSVIGPTIDLSSRQQENLNVDPNSGKSINVIRTFPGYGTLVWGARTLDGNSNEWKYISVRRFFNMVEESIKKSSQWAVFEPNTISTWVKISAMIENYLFVKWRDGALAGSKPEQAFYVHVGLGTTMTALDILEGRMNIEIGMAVARPAEFIVLKFTQLMQQS
jgi:phage tail sheath protein FI